MSTSCYLGAGFLYLRSSVCSHMDARKVYDLTAVHSYKIKCIYNLGPRAVNMLQDPPHRNLALIGRFHKIDSAAVVPLYV